MERNSPVKVLHKALGILAMFSAETPEWGVSELALELGIPKSTVYRVLRVLERHQFLEQDSASRHFRLGLNALDLGRRAYESLDLPRAALPVVERLAATSGAVVMLQILSPSHERVVCIERAQRRAPYQHTLPVGSTASGHAPSSAAVLLAFLPEEELETMLGSASAEPGSYLLSARIRSEIAEIRRRGFAVSTEDGGAQSAVSVAIRDSQVGVIGSLTLVVPRRALNYRTISLYFQLTRDTALAIERKVS